MPTAWPWIISKRCGQRICRAVRRSEHAVFDRHASVSGAELHRCPCIEIVRLLEDAIEACGHQAERFARVKPRQLVTLFGDCCFHRMRNRVDPGACRDTARGCVSVNNGSRIATRGAAFGSPQAIF